MKDRLKYSDAGVNIDTANDAKKEMARLLETGDMRLLNKVGAFASLYRFHFPEYRDPVLVMKTEEPGSKQLLASRFDRLESVCVDMVNHLVNDCIVLGARPLMVQDAIICGKLEKGSVTRIVKAVAEACRAQDCILSGGETSEQPGVLPEGIFILTSSIIGIAERDRIIDGSAISSRDAVIGVPSSGPHTNGYTLIRKLIELHPGCVDEQVEGMRFLDLVMEAHACYYKPLRGLFGTGIVTGLAHITGGGIRENLNRILPENLSAVIDLSAYEVPPVFSYIRNKGSVSDGEMLRTFNCGVGLAIVAKREGCPEIIEHLRGFGLKACPIGEIVDGRKTVETKGALVWGAYGK